MSAVTVKKLAAGVMSYVEAEVLPSLSGWQLWAAAAAMNALKQKAEPLVAMVIEHPAAKVIGVVSEDGTVDVDALTAALAETAKTRGKLELDIPAIGKVKFGEGDFEALRLHIEKAG